MNTRTQPFDLSDFTADPAPAAPAVPPAVVDAVSEKHGFPSRPASPRKPSAKAAPAAPQRSAVRHRRTNRTVPILFRLTEDVANRIRDLADSRNVAYGAVLETLLEAYERDQRK